MPFVCVFRPTSALTSRLLVNPHSPRCTLGALGCWGGGSLRMVLKVWWRGRCVESTDGVSQGPFPEDIDERHVSLKVTVTWMPGLVNGLESCLDCSAGYFAKSSGLRAKAFGLTFAPLHQPNGHVQFVFYSGHPGGRVGWDPFLRLPLASGILCLQA